MDDKYYGCYPETSSERKVEESSLAAGSLHCWQPRSARLGSEDEAMRLPKSSIVLLSKSVTDLHCLSTIKVGTLDQTPVFAKKKACRIFYLLTSTRTPHPLFQCWGASGRLCFARTGFFFARGDTHDYAPTLK